MSNNENRWSVRHAAAALLAALPLLLGAGAGCKSLGLPDNRLMNCQTNDDCKALDAKRPNCSNLRCVECAYDTDCESGVCTNNQCKTLFTAPADTGPEGPPENRDACLSRCKDQPCLDKCHADFPPMPPAEPTKKKKK